ncbi:GntR family transcriptional regulator [bacterium]|nr:GntR family transcriptional regulator [bacterium]
MNTSVHKKESLAERVANHLSDKIIRNEMQPDERIQEMRLVELLKVSRSSVREALLILERRHLVTISPNKGASVASLTDHDIRSIHEIYGALITHLAVDVTQKWKYEDLEPLFEYFNTLLNPELEKNIIGHVIDTGFDIVHLGCAISGNAYLKEMLDNLRFALYRTYYLAINHNRDEICHIITFYERILQAAKERDVDEDRLRMGELSMMVMEMALKGARNHRQAEQRSD